ncbi:glycosyltransferase family 2 protein [Nitrospira japonica]|nr:glycosyltransferase family 2 protein [Nitrospira japonica]
MDPFVSVIISAYNLGWCIEDTIRSVLAQTYQDFEVIVVDDASTDDTETRVAGFGDRIRYVRHASNQGTVRNAEGAPTRNTGVRHSRGELLAFLDGDDLWEPEKLAVQIEAARRYPDAGMIAVDGIQFNSSNGMIITPTLFNGIVKEYETLPYGAMLSASLYLPMLHHCLIETPSQVIIPKQVLDRVGLFHEGGGSSDYDMFIRVAARFPIILIKQSLVRYRYQPSSWSGQIDRRRFKHFEPNIAIWSRHLGIADEETQPVIRRRIAQELYEVTTSAFEDGRNGHRAWALSFLFGQFRRRPSWRTAYLFFRLWCPQRLEAALKPVIRRFV